MNWHCNKKKKPKEESRQSVASVAAQVGRRHEKQHEPGTLTSAVTKAKPAKVRTRPMGWRSCPTLALSGALVILKELVGVCLLACSRASG